ncbi:hypothetical protein QUB30_11290 [Microcoleus sp. BROC3]
MLDWQFQSGDQANSSWRCPTVAAGQIETIHQLRLQQVSLLPALLYPVGGF